MDAFLLESVLIGKKRNCKKVPLFYSSNFKRDCYRNEIPKGTVNSIGEVRDPGSVVRRNQFARAQKRENRISFFEKVLDISHRLCYTIITKGKGDLKMKKYIITYRSFKIHWDKEVYTETEKEIAEWRFDALKNCVNADNVKMEIKEEL